MHIDGDKGQYGHLNTALKLEGEFFQKQVKSGDAVLIFCNVTAEARWVRINEVLFSFVCLDLMSAGYI